MKVLLYGKPVLPYRDLLRQYLGEVPIQIDTLGYHEQDPRGLLLQAEAVVSNRWPPAQPFGSLLRLIQAPGAGYDEVNLDKVPRGCYFCNVYQHEKAIAEFVLLAILSFNWNLTAMMRSFAQGSWEFSSRFGAPGSRECSQLTVGVVGFGRSGRAVATTLSSLGAKILAFSQHSHPSDASVARFYSYSALKEIVPQVDYLVVCCGLSAVTTGLIDEKILTAMRADAVLVNVARGPVVEESSLYAALREKRIRGAHLDVWYQYPPEPQGRPSRYDFHSLPNVQMTPHVAGWSQLTIQRRWQAIAHNLLAVHAGKLPDNIVLPAQK